MKQATIHHIFLLTFIVHLFSDCANHPKLKSGLEGKVLPSVNLKLISSNYINTKDISKGSPIVLFLFSPDCPFCKSQTQEIINNMKSFQNIQFYFSTNASFEEVKYYYNHFKLNRFKNIVVGLDTANSLSSYFNANAVPYIAIYNKEKRLKQVIPGRIDTKIIKGITTD